MQRKSLRHAGFTLVVACLLSTGSHVVAKEKESDEFKAARTEFLKEFRRKELVHRVAAVEKLSAVTEVDASALIFKSCFIDQEKPVRDAAQGALRRLAEEPKIAEYYVSELKQAVKKPFQADERDRQGIYVLELLRAACITIDETLMADIVSVIDDKLLEERRRLIPLTVMDAYAEHGDFEQAFCAISLFAKSKAGMKLFAYRRCLVQAMAGIRDRRVVPFLIKLIPETDGQVQHDVIVALRYLTKQKFADDAISWQEWWAASKDAFDLPEAKEPKANRPRDASEMAASNGLVEGQANYYGIPICAKRVVFVLDTSGSMRGEPIEMAKRALIATIRELPEPVAFNVLMFDRTVFTWQPRMVFATSDAKDDAMTAVRSRGLDSATSSNAALNAALAQEAEAIFFLSDGEPTDGRAEDIVRSISIQNRLKRASIHTIGVVTDQRGGTGLSRFMEPLADRNWGKHLLLLK